MGVGWRMGGRCGWVSERWTLMDAGGWLEEAGWRQLPGSSWLEEGGIRV